MKSPYLNFLASTISRLDPIYPRDPFLAGSQQVPTPDHGHHGGGHAAEAAHAAHGGHSAADREPPLGLDIAQYAFLLALLSGLSMPIGAMIGLKLRPAHTTVAQWIAVGAGALLFAVSVELYGHAIHSYHEGHMEQVPMIILLTMSLIGSFGFTWITKAISGEEDDSDSEEEEEETHCAAPAAAHTAEKASPPHSLDSPTRRPSSPAASPRPRADTPMSQQPMMMKRAYTATSSITMDPPATSKSESRLKHLHKTTRGVKGLSAMLRQMESQRKLMAQKRWAHLREAMKKYHVVRYMQKITRMKQESSKLKQQQTEGRQSFKIPSDFWENMKRAWGQTNDSGPNPEELSQIQKDNRAAALNMLAMLSVDGVPEGILMGFMAAGGSLGVTFIISLFIANFPEAFAGGVLMLEGGFDTWQILCMWGGLMMLVASCAGTSCYVLLWLNPTYTGGHSAPLSIQILVAITEGLAGGAMISGIAACMLPEAYERRDKKGAIVLSGGFLCTFGFLLSLGIKIVLD